MITPDQVTPDLPVTYRPYDGGPAEHGHIVRLAPSKTNAYVQFEDDRPDHAKCCFLTDLEVRAAW